MDKFRVNLKKKMDKYIKLKGISYEYFNRLDGVKSLDGVSKNGGTTFKTLFEASKVLDIDVGNFLMFDDHTYIFKNSFNTFEEFFFFLSKKLKEVRFDKGLTALDVANKLGKIHIDNIYKIESAKGHISLKRFYDYLNILEITPEEFFLKDEIYEIKGNDIKNQITIDDFNNRIYELEEIKGRIVGVNISINPNIILFYPNAICLLLIIYQFVGLFNSLKEDNPFCENTVKKLKASQKISAVASLFWMFDFIFETFIVKNMSILVIIVLLFMFILFIGVTIALYILSELFNKAIEYKNENDLTI